MARHVTPRLPFHVGDALHHGAQWISLHPVSAALLVLAPACVVATVVVRSAARRSAPVAAARFAPLQGRRASPLHRGSSGISHQF